MRIITEVTKTPFSLLLIGPPGGRKTTLALQFPELYYINLDLNEAGPIRKLKELNAFKPFKMDTITIDDEGNQVPEDQRFDRFDKALTQAVTDPEVRTISLDSLTTLDDVIYNYVKKKMGRKDVLELQDWRLFRQLLVGTINKLRNSGKNSIIICHEEIVTDKQGSVDAYVPAVSTKIRDYFGGFFTDMWRSTVRPTVGNKEVQTLRTISDTRSELKNAWSLPPEITDPTYAKLEAYLTK